MTEWSTSWKASSDPAKQRKDRDNAPYHQQGRFLSARLADDVRERVGTKSLPIRTGDRVEVMRGDHEGAKGEVTDIDTDDHRIFVDGIERESVSGAETKISLAPSNLRITKLDLDDARRLAKFEVSEEEKEEIKVEAADEPEEPEEDVEEPEDSADDEEVAETDEDINETEGVDYEELVDGTIEDVKGRVTAEELDAAKVLEAEKANKNRVTLVEWLESRTEDDNR